MNVGDKVRMKYDFVGPNLMIPKGSIGSIASADFFKEVISIEFPAGLLKFSIQEFGDYCQLIKNEVTQVPKSLYDWYKKTSPYIGGTND